MNLQEKPIENKTFLIPETLGIIAGSRSLPLILAEQARLSGVKSIVAVGFTGETDPDLKTKVDTMIWLKVGQLNKLIQAFKSNEVTQVVMAGQIAPSNLFDLRPDWMAARLLWKLKLRNAHTLFGAVADALLEEGITLIEATPWLRPVMPKNDYHIGPPLTPTQMNDVDYGFTIAKTIAALDIGQSVVVKEGTVLAVEGFEGTDECLKRGGALAGSKAQAVAAKIAKTSHDFRFDIPCIGPKTIEICHQSGVSVLAIEAGRSLLLDRGELEENAKKWKITVLSRQVHHETDDPVQLVKEA